MGTPDCKSSTGGSLRPPTRLESNRKSSAAGRGHPSCRRPRLLAAPAGAAVPVATSGARVLLMELPFPFLRHAEFPIIMDKLKLFSPPAWFDFTKQLHCFAWLEDQW